MHRAQWSNCSSAPRYTMSVAGWMCITASLLFLLQNLCLLVSAALTAGRLASWVVARMHVQRRSHLEVAGARNLAVATTVEQANTIIAGGGIAGWHSGWGVMIIHCMW